MAKSKQKIKAVQLREGGESIKEIAKIVSVSKSTVSLWCRDIVLTPNQIKILHHRMVSKSYVGRMKGARAQYDARLKRIEDEKEKGIKEIAKLSDRDLLVAAVALYWGEGSKKSRQLSINNSDPEMIRFMMAAFRRIWKISEDRFAFHVGINEVHRGRDEELKRYWSKVVGISKRQFRKTIFIKAKNKKFYKNFLNHYGTLTIRVRKPMNIYYPVMGLIKGLIEGI